MSIGRKLARLVVLVLLVLASLEVGARIGLLLIAESSRIEWDPLRVGDLVVDLARDGTELPPGFDWMNDEVIHPFLGYVHDQTRRAAGTHGLLTRRSPIGYRRPGALRIAILGGSVAQRAAPAIAAELEQALAARGATLEVELVQLAYPGYKQPQQLQLLAYLLSLGAQFDLVVNLDGYNELALSIVENYLAGVFPLFPRRWDQRVARVPDTTRLREIGRVTVLLDLRRRIVESAVGSPLGHLAIVRFAAELALRFLDPALDAARERLRLLASEATFEARGPFTEFRRMEVLIGYVARNWMRSSLLLDGLSRESGAEYHHVLQPNQYLPDSKPLTAEELRSAYAPGQPADVVRIGYPILLARAGELRRRGVRFHDATRIFAGVEETLYVDTCCHVNDEGDRRLAAFVVERILATTALPALAPTR